MKQYLDLLQNILDNGVEKESDRANMPNTIGISHGVIKMDLSDGFPLLTTKKMYLKGIIHELLWFLRGDTNIKYLVDNNVNIWDGDAYRWYQTKIVPNGAPELAMEQFIEKVKNSVHLTIADPLPRRNPLCKGYTH
jgi:thymidylate synthase